MDKVDEVVKQLCEFRNGVFRMAPLDGPTDCFPSGFCAGFCAAREKVLRLTDALIEDIRTQADKRVGK